MSEIKVVNENTVNENAVNDNAAKQAAPRENAVAKPAESAARHWDAFFEPLLPMRSFFGANPFASMREFSRDIDRLWGSPAFGDMKAWTPVVDVQRSNGNLEVTAELPGLRKEEVKVEMTADALVIHGERRRENKEEREGFHRYERSYGNFYRAIPLPEGVKRDAVKAELGDGVLKIHVPVSEIAKNAREIPVEHAAAK